MKQKPCILIDGSSFFYRAFHALPPLINSKGQPTGAIYGVANMVKKINQQYQPELISVIFDAPGKTFREDIYPDYKAHRPPTPPDLKVQYEPLVKLLTAMGIHVYALQGVEADDVIGTLAKQAQEKNIPVWIATGDKDFAQVVNSHVTLFNSMTNQWLDTAKIKEKYGVTPQQFIDYLTLTGDSVDNIPGVPKCGPKTASKWLQAYDTLDNLLANAHEISGKIGDNLRASLAQLAISKELVTIRCDLELPFSLDNLRPQPEELGAIAALAETLEFKSWIKKSPTAQYVAATINDATLLNVWLDQQTCLGAAICINLETTNPDALQADITSISMCTNLSNSIEVPINESLLPILKKYLHSAAIIGHNLKYTINVLKKYGIEITNLTADVMLESYVLNSTATKHDLASLTAAYLESSGDKVQCIFVLHELFKNKLTNEEQHYLNTIELPLVKILAAMEFMGVAIDTHLLQAQNIFLQARIDDLEKRAWQLSGEHFNLQSPKQLAEIFYTKMHLPIIERTPSGQPSTAEEVLVALARNYELPALILEYRRLAKLVSTYLEALPKKVNPRTGRVHTSYNQAITATGRLSSSDPNLQNIPIRHPEGKMVRQAFIARPNYKIIAADYSQVELRIMAHLSQDTKLIEAFRNNHDIHQATASEIFNLPLAAVTPEQRRQAKAINFGLLYGMSAFGLAKQLDIARTEAQAYIDSYFAKYSGVAQYIASNLCSAKQHGFVATICGRKLYLPEILSTNKARQKAAERTAINAPIQGSAADIIKLAMLNIDKKLLELNINGAMIMQVHDELVFEIHRQDEERFIPQLKDSMEHAILLTVPLLVNISSGLNWDEAH